jgi:branched-chain amino acid transport system permease protein
VAYFETVVVLGIASIILAVSLDLLIGVAGLFSAAVGVFYGVGAYVASLIWLHWTSDLVVALVAAFIAGGLLAIPFVVPALRSKKDVTFVVASLAFASIVGEVFASWNSVTGGYTGLYGFPIATVFNIQISPGLPLVIASVILVVIVIAGKELLARSAWGLDLRATRDDERAASSLGVRGSWLRIQVAVVASGMAALAGVLYAAQVGYVDPSSFTLGESELIAAMVVLGGLGSFYGPVVGAILLTAIPAGLTFVTIDPAYLGLIEQTAFGLIIVVIIVVRPEGIMGGLGRVRARLRPLEISRRRGDDGV